MCMAWIHRLSHEYTTFHGLRKRALGEGKWPGNEAIIVYVQVHGGGGALQSLRILFAMSRNKLNSVPCIIMMISLHCLLKIYRNHIQTIQV